MDKKVLIISNRDLNDPGGRAEKFRTRKKILKKYDWEVIVQKVSADLYSAPTEAYKIYNLIQQKNIDVINSVNNPPQLHIIGAIAKFLTRKPWLVEYRDPLVNNPDLEAGSISTKLRSILERIIMNKADRIIWGDGMQLKKEYFEKYQKTITNKITKLPFLGFKEELFSESQPKKYEKFTLTYAGSFYKDLIEPYRFLQGIEEYTKSYTKDIHVQFYGDWNDKYQQKVEDLGLEDIIQTHEFVPHEEVVPILKGSDICVHIGGTNLENKLSIPSKIWDYMGSGNPILAVVDPEFRVAEFLQSNDLGIPVHPDNATGIAEAINRIRTGKFDHVSYQHISKKFTRDEKMKQLVSILDELA